MVVLEIAVFFDGRLAVALNDLPENPDKRNLLRGKAGSNLEWLSCLRTATETTAVYDAG
jgi:hypothetical protein